MSRNFEPKSFDPSAMDQIEARKETVSTNKLLNTATGQQNKIETPTVSKLVLSVVEKEQIDDSEQEKTVIENSFIRQIDDGKLETTSGAALKEKTTSCQSPTHQINDLPKPNDENIEQNSTEICRSILDSLISKTDFDEQQVPVLLFADSDEEMTETPEAVDPLSLSDNENSNKNVAPPSPCSTITILSSDTEEEEKPLSVIVRQKTGKRGRPRKTDILKESQFEKNKKELEKMSMSLRACHVSLDHKPFVKYIQKRSSLVKVNLGKRLSEQLIAKATRTDQIMSEDEREIEDSTNGEQTSDGESEINDKNDDVKTIREKDSSKSDPSDNKNSVNPEKVHELKAKLVDNNCALTDVTESELVTLLSITGPSPIKSSQMAEDVQKSADSPIPLPKKLTTGPTLASTGPLTTTGSTIGANGSTLATTGPSLTTTVPSTTSTNAATATTNPVTKTEDGYRCLLCAAQMKQKDVMAFQLHLIISHFTDRLTALICTKVLQSDVFQCPMCPCTNNLRNLTIHLGVKHQLVMKFYDEELQKRKPKEVIQDNNYVLNHEIVRNMCAVDGSGTGQNFKCQVCHYYFPTLGAVESHILGQHRDVAISCQMLQRPAQKKPVPDPESKPVEVNGSTMETVAMKQEISANPSQATNRSQNITPSSNGSNGQSTAVQNEASLTNQQSSNDSAIKCELCPGLPINASKLDYHLAEVHFKQELRTVVPQEAPYTCKITGCGQIFTTKSQILMHVLSVHQFLGLKYKEKVQQLKQRPLSQQRSTMTKEVFSCMLCNTKNMAEEFETENLLRNHLVDNHLAKLIAQDSKAALIKLSASTTCPVSSCVKSYDCRPDLADHFISEHLALYKLRFDDSIDPESRLLRYQTLKCSDCNVVEVDVIRVGIHKNKSHPGYLESKLRKLGVEGTLKPIIKIVHTPVSRKEQIIQDANRRARFCHSRDKGVVPQRSLLTPLKDLSVAGDFDVDVPPPVKTEVICLSPPPDKRDEICSSPPIISEDKNEQPINLQVEPLEETNGTTPVVTSPSLTPTKSQSTTTSSILKSFRREKKPSDVTTPISGSVGLGSGLDNSTSETIHNKENQRNFDDDDYCEILTELKVQRKDKIGGLFLEQVKRLEQLKNISNLDERRPTGAEIIQVHDDVTTRSTCSICFRDVWSPMDSRERKKVLFGRHLFRSHFHYQIKMDFLAEIFIRREKGEEDLNVRTCPRLNCNMASKGFAYTAEHIATEHNRAFELYWEMVRFGNVHRSRLYKFVEDHKDQFRPEREETDEDKTLETFKGGDTDEAVKLLKMFAKYSHMPDHTILVQPEACHVLARELPQCHECHKFVNGHGNDFAVCQFEGFRKVQKKEAKVLEHALITFEKFAFMDPHQDPIEEDRSLWTTIDKYLHPGLDSYNARFILKYTNDEFCSMFQEEMEVRKNYTGKVLWKRLQPKVREMCDVCSTSLFNYHWTCTNCGMIICIDCFRTRQTGYPLVYNAKKSEQDGEAKMNRPFKSRRIKRPDLDEHYWPMCKDLALHLPERFQLTQIISGNELLIMHRQFHEISKAEGLPTTCSLTSNSIENMESSEADINVDAFTHTDVDPSTTSNVEIEYDVPLPTCLKDLKECPICKEDLSGRLGSPFRLGGHFANHFYLELNEKLGVANDQFTGEDQLKCPDCEVVNNNVSHMRLHLGMEHGHFQKLLNKWKEAKKNLENVNLRVDTLKTCKICSMDFVKREVNKEEIRDHLHGHFLRNFNEQLPNWIDPSSSMENEKYFCLKCGGSEPTKDKFIRNHLRVYHGLIDLMYEKVGQYKKAALSKPVVDPAKKTGNNRLSTGIIKACQNQIPIPIRLTPKPSQQDLDKIKTDIVNNKICGICSEDAWKASDNQERRKVLYFRHLYQEHFYQFVKLDLLASMLGDGTGKIPRPSDLNSCPFKQSCVLRDKQRQCNGLGYIGEHVSVQHVYVLELYCQWKLHQSVSQIPLAQSTDPRVKLTHDDEEMNLAKKQLRLYSLHGQLSDGTEFVQCEDCSYYSSSLEQCHSCLTLGPGFDCLYKGSRKLIKVSPAFTEDVLMHFEISPNDDEVQILPTPVQVGQKRKLNLNEYKERTAQEVKREPETVQATAEKIPKLDVPETGKCSVCNIHMSQARILRHTVDHFIPDLIEIAKKSLKSHKSVTCYICGITSPKDSREAQWAEIAVHLGNNHPDVLEKLVTKNKRSDVVEEIGPSNNRRSLLRNSSSVEKNCSPVDKKSLSVVNESRESRSLLKRRQSTNGGTMSNKKIKQDGDVSEKDKYILPKVPPYTCPVCSSTSSTSDNLAKHFSQLHSSFDSDVLDIKTDDPSSNSSRSHSSKSKINDKILKQDDSRSFIQKPWLDYLKEVLPAHLFATELSPSLVADQTESAPEQNNTESLVVDTCPRIQELELHPPPRIATVVSTVARFPGVPHRWQCEGRLLQLTEPTLPDNMGLFHDHWSRGQPVLVSNSARHLDQNLWHPRAFLNDFGHLKHDLVNCLSGKTVPKAPLEQFWKGFEYIKDRLQDQNQTPMLLKLKDWPPSSDIAEYMPKRFNNLFDSFPLPEYTKREGIRNLAAYLPSYCLKPELGPKMYIAYGSALYSNKASTNLHIDMSDAVNCLVYVSSPIDSNRIEDTKEVFKEIDLAGCDIITKRRSRSVLPGALWHIFHPSDTVKIRDFLTKVALEKGKRLDPHDDPIHDQSSYLTGALRLRLYSEYGVRGYAIVQCAGDTVFIPAGACHQVRNLHNCIKVAEDYVSPENISHCLHLTQEFRHLTEWHTNHEDKLQMKSILYHAVKSAVTVLRKEQQLQPQDQPLQQ